MEEQRIELMPGKRQPTEGKWRGRGGHHSVPTRFRLLISELLGTTKSRIGWTGCSTLLHNTYCGNSVIDVVLESSLSVTIDYNLLCIRVCCFL